MAEYAARFDELRALGVDVAAVSVDPPERSRALAEQLGLRFPLLCDTAREVVQAYGILNREEQGGIAFPSTFVLDRDRTVSFRSLDRTVGRVSLDGVVAFLRAGITGPAPAVPARARIVPGLREWGRILKNALRHGIRSPWTSGKR